VYREQLFPVAIEIVKQQKKLNAMMTAYQDQLQETVRGVA
jgi:hypothetical protein